MKLDISNLNSVDDLVNFCKQHLESEENHEYRIWGEDEYKYMLRSLPTNLLIKLRSENNKPSIHDITIINLISHMKIISSTCQEILDVYKNRKV